MRWLLILGLAGCSDPRLPDQLVESRHVRYHYWADAGAPCPEALEQMDRFIELLGAKVKRAPPADFRVDYYRVRDLDAVRELCIPRAAACAIENKVYSTEWTHDHELVHAFLSHLETPPFLFLEGAATMFGCGPARWSGAPLIQVDLEPLVDNHAWSKALSETNHTAAGAFSRWLVDRHGLDAFVRFYESTPHRSSRDEVNAQFRAAFGVELSTALAEWHAGPAGRDGEFCLPVEDVCDGAPEVLLTAPPMTASVTAPVSCVDRVTLLELGAVPVTRLRFSASEPDRILKLRPCDPTGSASQQLNHTFFGAGTNNLAGWIDSWSTLRPGRYSLTIETIKQAFPRDVRSPPGGTATVELEAHGPVLGDSCTVEPIPIPADSWMVQFSLERSALGDAGVLRFEPASDRRIIGVYGSGFAMAPLCGGCASPTSCVPVSPGDGYPAWLRGPTSLHLERREDAGLAVQLVLEAP